MADLVVKGFPQSDGGKIESVIDHTGPASYVQLAAATPPTGGDPITAAAFGMKSIEYLDCSMDNTGTYNVTATNGAPDALGRPTWLLAWYVAATAAQAAGAVNLSASHVRIRAIGY
jgi:hypothetical protein